MPKIVSMRQRGDFKKTEGLLNRIIGWHYREKLNHYGAVGVQVLQDATPRDSGKTAESWSYEIAEEEGRLALYWKNDNRSPGGALVAILLQYGHGTRTGGFVEGIDYINPALRPVFEQMAKEAWKEVIG